MFVVAWELGSYRQLSRLNPALVAAVEGELHQALTSQGARCDRVEQGLRLYSLNHGEQEATRAVGDLVLQLQGILTRYRAELAGYGVVVEHVHRPDDVALRNLRSVIRAAPEDEGIWLTERVAPVLEEHVSVEQLGRLQRVLGAPAHHDGGTEGVREIASASSACETILSAIDPWLWGERDYGGILVFGLRPPSDLFVVEAALQRLFGASEGWLRVGPPAPGRVWQHGFAAEIPERELNELESLLTGTEVDVWRRTREFLLGYARSGRCDDRVDRGEAAFAAAYRLYFTGRIRALSHSLAPAVLVVHRLGDIPPAGRAFLDELLSEWADDAPFLIATAGEDAAGEDASSDGVAGRSRTQSVLGRSGLRRVEAPPLETLEIADAARRTLPESVTRRLRVAETAKATGGDPLSVYHHFRTLLQVASDRAAESLRSAKPEPRLDGGLVAEPGDRTHCEPPIHGTDARAVPPGIPMLSSVSMRFVTTLPGIVRDMLFLCESCYGVGELGDLLAVAERLGYDETEAQAVLHELSTQGFLGNFRVLRLLVSVDYQQLALELRDRAAEIAGRVRAYFLEAVLSERRPLDPVLYRLLIPEFGEQERRNAAGRLFERLLHVGDTGACWRLHDEEAGRLEAVPMEIRDPIRHRVMLAVWRLRLALSAGPSNEAERQYKEMPGPSHEPRIDGDLYRVTALYEFDTGRTEQAITSIKRAIVAYQAAPDEVGIAAANVDYARYLLVRESTLEALEQLNRGRLSRSSDARERVELHRMLLDGIASFLYGNLSRARESITRVRDEIGPSGPREQYLFAVLLQGRLHFEMGSYAAAVESFAHACTEAQRLNHDAARAVFERWLARSEAYAGRVDPARRRLEQFPPGGTRKGGTRKGGAWKDAEASGAQSGATERKLFLAEVEWFAGNAETALDVIEEFGGAREESGRTELPASFFTPERPDWSNGFASVEGHLAPGGRILGKLTRSFRAFLLSRVGRAEEGLSDLRELTRGEERSRSDPYSGLYCFLYSKLLQELPGTRPDNPVTMLGQSVKVMQERLSRIESPQDRSCVFEHNFWHQQLIRYARRHNMA